MAQTLTLVDHSAFVVSPSQLETIRTCPRQFLYKYLHRRVEVVPDAATQGGKAFDQALNLRYQRLGASAITPEVEAEQLAIIDRAYEGVELPLEEFRTPARYKEVVQAYNQHWGEEPFRVLGVQVPFMVELGDVYPRHASTQGQELPGVVRVLLRGILDLFVQLGDYTIIVDTKTSKSDIGGSYDNSAQMKAYCWSLQELARTNPGAGLPPRVHAAMINGVTIRPPYKEGWSPGKKFDDATGKWVRTAKSTDRPRNDFMRTMPCFYSAERLEEWRQDTLLWVETALGWVTRGHFPQSENHCTFHQEAAFTSYGYYGKPCPYLGVCSVPAEQRAMVLASDMFMDYDRGPLGHASQGGAK